MFKKKREAPFGAFSLISAVETASAWSAAGVVTALVLTTSAWVLVLV